MAPIEKHPNNHSGAHLPKPVNGLIQKGPTPPINPGPIRKDHKGSFTIHVNSLIRKSQTRTDKRRNPVINASQSPNNLANPSLVMSTTKVHPSKGDLMPSISKPNVFTGLLDTLQEGCTKTVQNLGNKLPPTGLDPEESRPQKGPTTSSIPTDAGWQDDSFMSTDATKHSHRSPPTLGDAKVEGQRNLARATKGDQSDLKTI